MRNKIEDQKTKLLFMLKANYDIAIVGGGISGMYAAYKLYNQDNTRKIVVIEKTDRLGGRLDSEHVTIKDPNGKSWPVKNELGGMRFNSEMVEFTQLLGDLKFTVTNGDLVLFEMAGPENHYNMRRHSFTFGDACTNEIWKDVYNLKENEKNQKPTTILGWAMAAINKENGQAADYVPDSADDWSKFRNEFTYKGQTINEWGLWPILTDCGISNEAIEMIISSIGFSGPVHQQINAGEQLQILFDFPTVTEFYTLYHGMETVVSTLETKLTSFGVDIVKEAEVVSVDRNGSNPSIQVSIKGADPVTCESSDLILALPKFALNNLLYNSSHEVVTNVNFKSDIDSLQSMHLGKINLFYDCRWWRDEAAGTGPLHGPNFTDLTTGSVYVFDPILDDEQEAKYRALLLTDEDAAYDFWNKCSLEYTGPSAITIYNDFIKTGYWDQLQNIGKPYIPLQPEAQPTDAKPASINVIDEVNRQLAKIFDNNNVPLPVSTTIRLYTENDPIGYGYHQWKLNANDAVIKERIYELSDNIYLCNEAYSDMQGWVNGSLRSTDIVLDKVYKIPPISDEVRVKHKAEVDAFMAKASASRRKVVRNIKAKKRQLKTS